MLLWMSSFSLLCMGCSEEGYSNCTWRTGLTRNQQPGSAGFFEGPDQQPLQVAFPHAFLQIMHSVQGVWIAGSNVKQICNAHPAYAVVDEGVKLGQPQTA